jgi:hypothetical protein
MKRVAGRVERRRDENINSRVNEEETEKEKTTFLSGKKLREICYLFIVFGFFFGGFMIPVHLCWMVLLLTAALLYQLQLKEESDHMIFEH